MVLLLIQVGSPLILLATLAFWRAGLIEKTLLALAAIASVVAVALAGLWLTLPWYTPWVLGALVLPALWCAMRRRTSDPGRGWSRLAGIAACGGVAVATVALAAAAVRAQQPPPGPAVALASPLGQGSYLVVNGGNAALVNAHFETLRPQTARQVQFRGQSYGLDIVGLNPLGLAANGWQPRDPARYPIFGKAVLAPCPGRVVARRDDRADMPVATVDQEVMPGNHVVLDCGGVHVLLAHLKRGSVAVRTGQQVKLGQRLGAVGNSGNSDVPHLHIHAQRPGPPRAPFAAEPLPMLIGQRYLARGDRL
ncbi:MAG: M23 family metallopeptidase [Cypionkella sp.]